MQYTPGYVPPEKYSGEPRRPPADVYCLGLLAYELLTGTSAFPKDPEEFIAAQKAVDYTALVEARPGIPDRLAELIESMLHFKPSDRPDALTIARGLAVALEPNSWRDYLKAGMEKFGDNSFGPAFELLSNGVFAQDADIRSSDFLEGLEALSIVASNTAKMSAIAQPLMRRFCQSAIARGSSLPATIATRLFTDLSAAAVD
jgi:serine/threonine protein kinase